MLSGRRLLLALTLLLAAGLALALSAIGADFSAQTSSATSLAGQDLTPFAPSSASASRTSGTTCQVTWTPAGSTPAAVRFDVFDGGGTTLASGINGTSATITVTSAAVTIRVGARVGQWVSGTRTLAAPGCPAGLSAPTGLVVTAGNQQAVATWNVPAQDGGSAITGYSATAVPVDGSLPTRNCSTPASPRTCTFTGLTNGAQYTVTVRATNAIGNGESATGTVIPYPADVMAPAALGVWLDAQANSSLATAADCSGTGSTAPAGGTRINCWKNQGATGTNATTTAAANAAAYTPGALNGHPALRFDRARPDGYRITGTGIGTLGSNDRTILAVAAGRTVADTGTNNTAAIALWPGAHSGMQFSSTAGTVNGVSAVAYNSVPTLTQATRPLTADTTGVLSAVFGQSGGTAQASVATNGGGATGGQLPGPWRSYTDLLRIGSVYDSAQNYYVPLDGDIGEIIILNRSVTDSERRSIEEYLARKWSALLAPQAPTGVVATGGITSVAVSWTAPVSDGGSPITGYTATAMPGGQTCSAATVSGCTITGLSTGGSYSITVTATNAIGTGPPSAAVTAELPPVGWLAFAGAADRAGNTANSTLPASVTPAFADWTSVQEGSWHTCALRTAGGLYCWGQNTYGQLGLGDNATRTNPQQVGAQTWLAVTSGGSFSCAVRSDRTLWCWGQNSGGQLGQGSTSPASSTVPLQVGTASDWRAVSAGLGNVCGLKTDNTLWCWGGNANYLVGDGTTTNRYAPVPVGAATWSNVDLSTAHACGVRTDGTLACWGSNSNGEQGTAPRARRCRPPPRSVR